MTHGVLSPWVVFPPAIALMLVVCFLQAHIIRSKGPASRRKIRTANGWVMLLAIPTLAAGFCLVSPSLTPRAFLLTWAAAVGLLCIAVLLAVLDMLNTWRLTAGSRRDTVRAFGALGVARQRSDQRQSQARASDSSGAPAEGDDA